MTTPPPPQPTTPTPSAYHQPSSPFSPRIQYYSTTPTQTPRQPSSPSHISPRVAQRSTTPTHVSKQYLPPSSPAGGILSPSHGYGHMSPGRVTPQRTGTGGVRHSFGGDEFGLDVLTDDDGEGDDVANQNGMLGAVGGGDDDDLVSMVGGGGGVFLGNDSSDDCDDDDEVGGAHTPVESPVKPEAQQTETAPSARSTPTPQGINGARNSTPTMERVVSSPRVSSPRVSSPRVSSPRVSSPQVRARKLLIEDEESADEVEKEGDAEGEGLGDITGFSELDADNSILSGLRNGLSSRGGTRRGSLLSTGITVDGNVDEKDKASEKDQSREASLSPIARLATPTHPQTPHSQTPQQRRPRSPHTPTRNSIAGSPTPRAATLASGASGHGRSGHSRASSRSSVFSVISPSSPSRLTAAAAAVAAAASASATPTASNRYNPGDKDQTTMLLLDDFTAQFNAVNHRHSTTGHRPQQPRGSISGLFSPLSKSETQATPWKSVSGTPDNTGGSKFLLDFDIPPPPTPRSIPSITPRELEQLKSDHLAQLAELRANLSGKEAEVATLRTGIREAELRCGALREELGECEERMRAEMDGALKQMRESAQAQFDEAVARWEEERKSLLRESEEARGRFEDEVEQVRVQFGEVERLLEEAGNREREKERECEGLRTDVESLQRELEEARNGTQEARNGAEEASASPPPCAKCAARESEPAQPPPGAASKEEVDRIAKELHVLYKQKHETKVAALKKSYEGKWEKRVRGLETEIDRLNAAVAEYESVPRPSTAHGSTAKEKEEAEEKLRAATEEMEKLHHEVLVLRDQNEALKGAVEKERREKGELVGAVEEMLALQMQTLSEAEAAAAAEEAAAQANAAAPQAPAGGSTAGAAPGQKQRPSGLAKPGTLKVKDVKRLERGWEGVRRRASGIGMLPASPAPGPAGTAASAPPQQASGIAQPRMGSLRGGIERMGRGARDAGER
ncbi:hypothetical protein BDZ91DRAFT_765999 [Kalaharituber pfeilii]|nr:hypothetical protein BDZ91DRAFT_765999 [Kalaharituber pfeilii]